MSERLTPERLVELRRIAEAATKGELGIASAFDPPTVLALLGEIERLEHEVMHLRDFLAESEAKASRLRKRYETLRSAVEDVADLLDRLRGAVEKARRLHCIDRDPYEDGRLAGWGTAVKWLRKALAEHGGDDERV